MPSIFHAMQRLARIGAGYAMITAGTIMIFTPGPGLITIAGGLALLSQDVPWAGRASEWLKAKARRLPNTDTPSDEGEPG